MSVQDDDPEDHTIDLPPVRRGPGRPPRQQSEPAASADPVGIIAQAIAKALADNDTRPRVPIKYGEDDRSEVWLIANKHFHVAAECLAYSQIAGSVHGMEGMGIKVDNGVRFAVRERYAQGLVDTGHARLPPRSS